MSTTLDLSQVEAGFRDPVLDAQACFRKTLDAMANPGRMVGLDVNTSPPGLDLASAALALTLMDFDTPVFLSPSLRTEAITSWLRFHCSAPITSVPVEASFAFLAQADAWPDLDTFNPGEAKYPDRSTSLVIQLASLTNGSEIVLTGPGIENEARIRPAGLPKNFWDDRAANVRDFQLGVDCYLTSASNLLALPRTTRTRLV